MANINCTVYFRERGTSKIYPLKQAKGRIGSYVIRWYEGTRQRQKVHLPGKVHLPVRPLHRQHKLGKASAEFGQFRRGRSN